MDMTVVNGGAGPLRLVLKGRLDAAGTEQVEAAFTAQVRGAAGDSLVDLSAVSFVGSLGIRMLIAAARGADRAGRRMVIFGAQPAVAEVFQTTALDDLIPVATDEAAALARLAA